MKIAMVSEHASPLAALGRRRRRRAERARRRAARPSAGWATRSTSTPAATTPTCPSACRWAPASTVVHVPAGPPRLDAQGRAAPVHGRRSAAGWPRDWARAGRPDVVHAHFWMSGLAALRGRASGRACPWCRRSTRSAASSGATSARRTPARAERLACERRLAPDADLVVATCTRRGGRAAPRWARDRDRRHASCRAASTPRTSRPAGPADARRRRAAPAARRRPAGRAQGLRPRRPRAGRPAGRRAGDRRRTAVRAARRDPEARRLRALAAELGVADRVRLTGQLPHAGLPPSTARPTWCWPRPGTSPSASPRSRRRPAAPPSWAPPSAGCSTRSTTASPAGWCRPATRRRRRGRRGILVDRAAAARWGRAARARALERFDWAASPARPRRPWAGRALSDGSVPRPVPAVPRAPAEAARRPVPATAPAGPATGIPVRSTRLARRARRQLEAGLRSLARRATWSGPGASGWRPPSSGGGPPAGGRQRGQRGRGAAPHR